MSSQLTLIQLHQMAAEGTLVGAFDVANDDYHAGPGISSTDIKKAMKSMKKWLHHKKNPTGKTEALIIGDMFHTLTREPHLFSEKFAVKPEGLRSDKRSERFHQFVKEAKGRTIVSLAMEEDARCLADAVLRSPRALSYSMGAVERAFYWIDPETGLLCKCRTDSINFKRGTIADYKSTKDASADGFMRSCAEYGYGISNAWYIDGVNLALEQAPDLVLNPERKIITGFIFVAVEKEEPNEVAFWDLPPEYIDNCREKNREVLAKIARAIRENVFPGYSDKIQTLQPKAWHFHNVEYNEEVA